MNETSKRLSISRRGFLGATAATAALGLGKLPAFAAEGEPLKFWDMVWGTGSTYTAAAKALAGQYQPAGDALGVRYQSIPWANWYQTFTSAAASGTTPAVSSGAAFLPFYFMEQGVAAPADDLVALLDKQGKNDFLPGLLDAMKTDDGYAGVPWSMDLRVLWYRKSLLEKAGADVPTDWDSYIKAGEALKKIGVGGLGLAAGSTTTDAQHTVSALMINNGGGLFSPDGKLDCVTDRNIETLDFLNELVSKGIIDPYAASYTSDNLANDWKSGRVGMGFGQTGLDKTFPADKQTDIVVAHPITGRHGDKGTVYYINPLWMFKTTPSQPSSEQFLAWYLDHMSVYWTTAVSTDLPVKKSIAELPAIQNNPNLVLSINEWQPIGKTIGARAPHAFAALNAVDGGAASAAFVQQIVQGKTQSKQILETLQAALEKVVK
jgi:multiple sugar transport system substrate-binding protein